MLAAVNVMLEFWIPIAPIRISACEVVVAVPVTPVVAAVVLPPVAVWSLRDVFRTPAA